LLSKKLLSISIIGIDPVLWTLIFMSIVSLAVILERLIVFYKISRQIDNLSALKIRLLLEKRLGILATFGNNAPFIGLFGTVLGVMSAFYMIGDSGGEFEIELIMKGISEALVATATGLFVAIPCVIFYNYFTKKIRTILLQKEIKEC